MAVLTDRSQSRCVGVESEQHLVELARGGSVAAFEVIVLRYQEPLLRHCRRMLTPTEAEDAVQEAFLAAFRTIDRTGPDLRLGGWLFRIAHNAALGILRRRISTAPVEELPLVTESADDTVERRQQLRDTLEAISNLPEAERRALIARVLAGSGHREIATALGRSEGSVRQLLHRARTRLRECAAALAPLLVRLAPTTLGERLGGFPCALRGGAILAVGFTAVGGGSAVLSTGPARIGSHAPDGEHMSRPAVSFDRRSQGDPRVVIRVSERTRTRRGDRTAERTSMTRVAGQPAGGIHNGSTKWATRFDRRGAATATPRSSSGDAGTSGTQPIATPGVPGSSTVATTNQPSALPATPLGASAPGGSGTALGQSGAAPGQSDTTPGQSGTVPGQSNTTPGQSGATPGQSNTTPGRSRATSGRSDTTPRQSAAPGQSRSTTS